MVRLLSDYSRRKGGVDMVLVQMKKGLIEKYIVHDVFFISQKTLVFFWRTKIIKNAHTRYIRK